MRRERRSLTHVGGEVALRGDPELAAVLARALTVPSSVEATSVDPRTGRPIGEAEARAHVHGFHTYPARMHPTTARELVRALSEPGSTVLDPFCGSGTVLVEARLSGRRAIGTDVNPLAIALARRKVTPASAEHRAALLEGAAEVARVASERRRARSGASRRYDRDDVATFDPHVLLELDGLRVGLERLGDAAVRDDLYLVLSSILVKTSRKAADTVAGARPTRIAAGYPTRLFLAKTEELARAFAEIEPSLSAAPSAVVSQDDARVLSSVPSTSVELVVTSPPYAGVYDYVEHHRLRLRWLGLREDAFERHELGARRELSHLEPRDAIDEFANQMGDTLSALARVVVPGGRVVLLVADSAFGATALRIDELLAALARRTGFEAIAVASQERPHFHRGTARAFDRAPKREHAVLLGRSTRALDTRSQSAGTGPRARPPRRPRSR